MNWEWSRQPGNFKSLNAMSALSRGTRISLYSACCAPIAMCTVRSLAANRANATRTLFSLMETLRVPVRNPRPHSQCGHQHHEALEQWSTRTSKSCESIAAASLLTPSVFGGIRIRSGYGRDRAGSCPASANIPRIGDRRCQRRNRTFKRVRRAVTARMNAVNTALLTAPGQPRSKCVSK